MQNNLSFSILKSKRNFQSKEIKTNLTKIDLIGNNFTSPKSENKTLWKNITNNVNTVEQINRKKLENKTFGPINGTNETQNNQLNHQIAGFYENTKENASLSNKTESDQKIEPKDEISGIILSTDGNEPKILTLDSLTKNASIDSIIVVGKQSKIGNLTKFTATDREAPFMGNLARNESSILEERNGYLTNGDLTNKHENLVYWNENQTAENSTHEINYQQEGNATEMNDNQTIADLITDKENKNVFQSNQIEGNLTTLPLDTIKKKEILFLLQRIKIKI